MEKHPDYETIQTETRGRVGLVTLDRPDALNALSATLMDELIAALAAYDADPQIGAIVLTGSERAFAAGADIKEMAGLGFVDAFLGDEAAGWEAVTRIRKPIIAAVAGFALGGGCELAMMCDIILAAETAKFGQPEIKLGIIPGIGGTQRLVRAVGKAKAMEMCLTGRMMDAQEAERAGLVARIVAADDLVGEAVKLAAAIASQSMGATMMVKEAINAAFNMPLSEGLKHERRLFHALFSTDDQKEGMAAFVEKRPAQFRNR